MQGRVGEGLTCRRPLAGAQLEQLFFGTLHVILTLLAIRGDGMQLVLDLARGTVLGLELVPDLFQLLLFAAIGARGSSLGLALHHCASHAHTHCMFRWCAAKGARAPACQYGDGQRQTCLTRS